jgi:hypothetical protein
MSTFARYVSTGFRNTSEENGLKQESVVLQVVELRRFWCGLLGRTDLLRRLRA